MGISSRPRGIIFSLSLHLHPCFVYVSSKGSGESAHISCEPLLLNDVKSAKIMCWLTYVPCDAISQ